MVSRNIRMLIEDPGKFYTPKKRPSGHDLSAGFGKDNGGAIPSNLLKGKQKNRYAQQLERIMAFLS